MDINEKNLIEVNGVKSGQRAILIDGKVFLIGAGGSSLNSQSNCSNNHSIDLSFVTASSYQILEGFQGTDKHGNLIEGRIPIEKGIIITPGTQKKEYSNVYIDGTLFILGDKNLVSDNIKKGQIIFNVEGTYEGDPIEILDATAFSSDVVEGQIFYNNNGKQTGSMPKLISENISINNGSLNIFGKSYVQKQGLNVEMKDINGVGDLSEENIAEGKSICGISGTFKGNEITAGVLVSDDEGNLKIQPLSFNGTTPVFEGDPIQYSQLYTFNTGVSQPSFSELS